MDAARKLGSEDSADEGSGSKLEMKLNKAVLKVLKSSEMDESLQYDLDELTFREFLNDKLLIVMAIRRGVPYQFFSLVKEMTPFNMNDWSEFLDISVKSLQRYKADKRRFKSIHTEKIIELVEVTEFGTTVFGSMSRFKRWLDTPSYALGKMCPIDLLKDSYGKELVMGELVRINEGILA